MKERRDIVEETLVPGASVARVARRNDVNANQVFYWRKLFREGRLGISMNPQLLPVKVEAEQAAAADRSRPPQSRCAFLRAVRSFRQTLQHGAQSHHVHSVPARTLQGKSSQFDVLIRRSDASGNSAPRTLP